MVSEGLRVRQAEKPAKGVWNRTEVGKRGGTSRAMKERATGEARTSLRGGDEGRVAWQMGKRNRPPSLVLCVKDTFSQGPACRFSDSDLILTQPSFNLCNSFKLQSCTA